MEQETRRWWQERRQLGVEAIALALAAAFFVMLAPQAEHGPPGVPFFYVSALLLCSAAFVSFVQRCADLLRLACTRCSRNFWGLPDGLPLPTRSRCAHCGLELAQVRDATAEG